MIKQIKYKKKTSLKNRYQDFLQLIKGCELVFNYVQLLYHKCRKISFNCGANNKSYQLKNIANFFNML